MQVKIRMEAIVWVGNNAHTFREFVSDRNGSMAKAFRESVHFFASHVGNATGKSVRVVWFESSQIV